MSSYSAEEFNRLMTLMEGANTGNLNNKNLNNLIRLKAKYSNLGFNVKNLFNKSNKVKRKELENVFNELNINYKISPRQAGGKYKRTSKNKSKKKSNNKQKRKIRIGPRGGKYVLVNGRKKYI